MLPKVRVHILSYLSYSVLNEGLPFLIIATDPVQGNLQINVKRSNLMLETAVYRSDESWPCKGATLALAATNLTTTWASVSKYRYTTAA